MIDFLRSWVFNIVTLAILIVLIEMLIPSGKIKKFVNLISGFIIMIAIITPILEFLAGGIDINDIQLNNELFIDRKQVQESSRINKEEQMEQIVAVYRSNLLKHLEDTAREISGTQDVTADVIINEDYSSANFGEIKRVYIYLKPDEKAASGSMVKPVENIDYIIIGEEDVRKQSIETVDDEIRTKLEDKISMLWNVSRDDIVIGMRE